MWNWKDQNYRGLFFAFLFTFTFQCIADDHQIPNNASRSANASRPQGLSADEKAADSITSGLWVLITDLGPEALASINEKELDRADLCFKLAVFKERFRECLAETSKNLRNSFLPFVEIRDVQKKEFRYNVEEITQFKQDMLKQLSYFDTYRNFCTKQNRNKKPPTIAEVRVTLLSQIHSAVVLYRKASQVEVNIDKLLAPYKDGALLTTAEEKVIRELKRE